MFDRCRRALALFVVCCLCSFIAVSPLSADAGARFSGKVLATDGVTPRVGVVVALVDTESQQTFRAPATSSAGMFRLDGAPAGTYRIVAETDEGAYLAGDPVQLASGQNRPLELRLGGASPNYQSGGGTGAGGGGLAPWAKWVIVGAIVVTSVAVIDEVTEDDEEDASPF